MRLPAFSLPDPVRDKLLLGAVVTSVALAAFLSFSVQPLVGKLLLPVQGGSASTWLGTMVYFQLALLLGYSWAAWLLGRRPLVQVASTMGLGVIAMIGTRLSWVQESSWTGIGGIVLTLAVAALPAMMLLFSAGPLLHGWLRRRNQPVPYHLYAFSNAGSLLAVLIYPFTIERSVGLSDQISSWQALLALFIGLIGVAGFIFMRSTPPAPAADEVAETIPYGRIGSWLGLSILACVGMLGATHHLAAEIGSGPVAWVGPFGLYLASFLVIFSGVWRPQFTLVCLGWLAVSLAGFMLTKGVGSATVDGVRALWLLSLTASGSFFCNGLLHEARPQHRFAFFYLVLAAGGVLGGLFASLVAPVLFLRPSEFIFVSCILVLIGLVRLLDRRNPMAVTVAVVIVIAPVMGLVWTQTADQSAGMLQVRRFRNIYGCSMLKSDQNGLILSNETTTHGTQLVATPEARRRPTLYYTESSGVGRSIEQLQKTRPSIKMGVIGLGAGTLAAYARPADTVDFWDIDPKAIRIARDYFTFITDSPGTVHITQSDGRKGLETTKTDYDLIVVDAFSGDAIPPHLLTREALGVYFKRLESRQGILAIHATNRYNNIFPIIASTAHTLGWSALKVVTDISSTTDTRDWDCVNTQYILLVPPNRIAAVASWLPAEEDDGRVKRTVTQYDPLPPGRSILWTDDRHATLDSLALGKYLHGN